jgi:heme-degrading monooxygenase HmoA
VIVEHAVISVVPGREGEFQLAFPAAEAVIAQAAGFRWIEMHRSLERPSVFLLRVGWDAVEDHVMGFRQSPRFDDWRAVIGPFFAAPPSVEHYEPRARTDRQIPDADWEN